MQCNKKVEGGDHDTILLKIVQSCQKAKTTIKTFTPQDLSCKSKLLAWIHAASEKIYTKIIPNHFGPDFSFRPGAEMKQPLQSESLCSANLKDKASTIGHVIMWSGFNQECNMNIINCLESIQLIISKARHCSNEEEIWDWIAALALSVRATVTFACKRVHLKKINWEACDISILKEKILLEACYLTYAVGSTFSPACHRYIGKSSKAGECPNVVGAVKAFVQYLLRENHDAPIQMPLLQMLYSTNFHQSKIGFDWFLKVHTANKSQIERKQNQQLDISTSTRQKLSDILKLKEISALCAEIGKAQTEFLRSSKVDTNEDMVHLNHVEKKSMSALEAIGANGIHKSEMYFFSTCLAIFTMFVYELLKFPDNTRDKVIGRKVLVKYLAAALGKTDNKSKGRECIKNVLQNLISGTAPLFSHQFVASVLQGSVVTVGESTKIFPPFSIPIDDVWKSHFPDDCRTLSNNDKLNKQTSNKSNKDKEEQQKHQKQARKGKDYTIQGKSKDKTETEAASDDIATAVLKTKVGTGMREAVQSVILGRGKDTGSKVKEGEREEKKRKMPQYEGDKNAQNKAGAGAGDGTGTLVPAKKKEQLGINNAQDKAGALMSAKETEQLGHNPKAGILKSSAAAIGSEPVQEKMDESERVPRRSPRKKIKSYRGQAWRV